MSEFYWRLEKCLNYLTGVVFRVRGIGQKSVKVTESMYYFLPPKMSAVVDGI